ncbi:MAG: LURP-one-related/scramblase family protein [Gaiellaceae bacterium]
MSEWLQSDRFAIDQLIRPLANLYRISAGPAPVAFVRQKRMAIKEDIRFYADESETEELFRIKARSVMELGGRYDVTTPAGERVGVLGKVFGKSLLRSTWSIMDANEQEIAVAKERSQLWAIVRRVIDAVPYGDFIPIVFHFTIDAGDRHLGDLTRRLGVRDRYDLDLSGDTERAIDRRLAIALAIALDALQSR